MVRSLDAIEQLARRIEEAAAGAVDDAAVARTVRDLTTGNPYFFSLDGEMTLVMAASVPRPARSIVYCFRSRDHAGKQLPGPARILPHARGPGGSGGRQPPCMNQSRGATCLFKEEDQHKPSDLPLPCCPNRFPCGKK